MATKVVGLQLPAQLLVLALVPCLLQAQQHLVFILAQVVLLAASQVDQVDLLQMLQCHQVVLQEVILLSVEVLLDQDQCIPQDLQDGLADLSFLEDSLVQEVLQDQVLPLDLLGQEKEVHMVLLRIVPGLLLEDQVVLVFDHPSDLSHEVPLQDRWHLAGEKLTTFQWIA